MYLGFHRIHSSVPLSEIRQQTVVQSILKNVNARLTIHWWNKNETDITTLGFFINADPGNFLCENMKSMYAPKSANTIKLTKRKFLPSNAITPLHLPS